MVGLIVRWIGKKTGIIVDEGISKEEAALNKAGRQANCTDCYLWAEPGFCNITDTIDHLAYNAGVELSKKYPDNVKGTEALGFSIDNNTTPEDVAKSIYKDGVEIVKRGMVDKPKLFGGVEVDFDYALSFDEYKGIPRSCFSSLTGGLSPKIVTCENYGSVNK